MGTEWLLKHGTRDIDVEIAKLEWAATNRTLRLDEWKYIRNEVIRLKYKRRIILDDIYKRIRK